VPLSSVASRIACQGAREHFPAKRAICESRKTHTNNRLSKMLASTSLACYTAGVALKREGACEQD
jgi:hypothetical protein